MTISLEAKANGTQGAIKVNGADVVVVDPTGIISGVNKSAVSQMPVLGTAVATTSGTAIDFTSIPAWAKRITVMLDGVSTTGTSILLLRAGAGSVATTNYSGQTAGASSVVLGASSRTDGFPLNSSTAATDTWRGSLTLTLLNAATNVWSMQGVLGNAAATSCYFMAGTVALPGTLDRVRLTTPGGTDTFDLGSANLLIE
jgi:hypothetical protein